MRALAERVTPAFMRRRGSDEESSFHRDGSLQAILAEQRRYQEEFLQLNDKLEAELDVHPDRKRGFIAKILGTFVPEYFQDWLPYSTLKMIRERSDIIELLEEQQRVNLNNQGKAIANLALVAMEGEDLLSGLEEDIAKAEEEKWDARQLHDYLRDMAQKIANPLGASGLGIDIPEIVGELLAHEFGSFSPEKKERQRLALLAELRKTAELQREYVKMLGTQAAANLLAYHAALSQYYQYTTISRPTQAIRESAHIMTESNKAMYVSRAAVIATVRRSIDATCIMLDAVKRVPDYAIASPEMKAFITRQNEKLQAKLRELEEVCPKGALPAGVSEGALIIDVPSSSAVEEKAVKVGGA